MTAAAAAVPDPSAFSYGLQGLDRAITRHSQARQKRDLIGAYVSAAEGVWWICACDEQLSGSRTKGPYALARDSGPDGQVVPGLRWVRDRHSHRLPITTGKDDRGFFDPHPGGVLYIASSQYVWKRVERVRTSDRHDARDPDRRQAYAKYVSERDTLAVLQQAQRWLSQPASGDSIE